MPDCGPGKGSAALVILAPVLMPAVTKAGIGPVHVGIVFITHPAIAGAAAP